MIIKLPDSWDSAPLGDVCKTLKGKKPKNSGTSSKVRTIPYVNIKAFETGLPIEYAEPGDYPKCSREDVLIVWDGARSGLIGRGVSGYIGSTLSKIRSDIIDNAYLYYFLQSQYNYINTNTKGVGIPHVDPTVLFAIDFPIAPPNEQKRIVAEIEKQFSRLDEAVENLKRVKANLKRYKASVLKAAVEGKLTEEWRDKNKADIISENIFDIVSGKRISNYNELCKHAKKTGKPKPKKPSNIDTKFSVDEEVLNTMASIPKEWQYVHIAFITNDKPDSVVDGPFGSSVNVKKDYIESGIPVIRIHNIVPFQFINDNLKYLRKEKFGKLRRHNILAGDILFGKVGTIGNSCIYPNNMQEGMLSTTGSCRIRVDEGLYHKNFLCLVLNAYKPIFNRIASSAVQAFLNMQTIKKFPIPLLSLNEQEAIMKQVDVLLSVAERIEIQVDKGVTRAERLRQSILAQAFSGLLIQSKES